MHVIAAVDTAVAKSPTISFSLAEFRFRRCGLRRSYHYYKTALFTTQKDNEIMTLFDWQFG